MKSSSTPIYHVREPTVGSRIIRPISCLFPLTIVNPRYKTFSVSELRKIADRYFFGGRIAKGFPDDYKIEVPCGHCRFCQKRHRRAWSFRITSELILYSSVEKGRVLQPDTPVSFFCTLTFEDRYLDDPNFRPRFAVRQWLDNLRKMYGFSQRVRHFFIGEFGPNNTERLHFHGLIFGVPYKTLKYQDLWSSWKYGRSDFSPVRNAVKCGSYLTKYLLKYSNPKDRKQCRLLCSRGIGLSALDDNLKKSIDDLKPSVIRYGNSYNIHRYYITKYLDDNQRFFRSLIRYDDPCSTFNLNGQIFGRYFDFLRYRQTLKYQDLRENTYFNNYYYGKFFNS